MAGHSKWANIRRRKEAQDAKRGKIFTKVIKEISVAVRAAGPDPDSNPRLRLAISNARGVNMPKDKITKAIQKAQSPGGENYVETSFEAIGPGGGAIFIECTTDNKTRTVANIRAALNKHGGQLAKDGALQFIFEEQGLFVLDAKGLCEEDFTIGAIDAGALEVEFDGEMALVATEKKDFGAFQKELHRLGIVPLEARANRAVLSTKALADGQLQMAAKLIDALEDDDDIQRVYHNMEGL